MHLDGPTAAVDSDVSRCRARPGTNTLAGGPLHTAPGLSADPFADPIGGGSAGSLARWSRRR